MNSPCWAIARYCNINLFEKESGDLDCMVNQRCLLLIDDVVEVDCEEKMYGKRMHLKEEDQSLILVNA